MPEWGLHEQQKDLCRLQLQPQSLPQRSGTAVNPGLLLCRSDQSNPCHLSSEFLPGISQERTAEVESKSSVPVLAAGHAPRVIVDESLNFSQSPFSHLSSEDHRTR